MKAIRHSGAKTFLVAIMLLFHGTLAGEEYRVFRDVDGRSVKGLFLDYDVTNKTVLIQRADGRVFEVRKQALSEADRQYVHDQLLLHPLIITADLRKTDQKLGFEDNRYHSEYVSCQGYEVALENHTEETLRDIRIGYCIFYSQARKKNAQQNVFKGMHYGSQTIGSMDPCSKFVHHTEGIFLYNYKAYQGTTLYGSRHVDVSVGSVQGLWMRVVATLPSGNRIVQEYRSPENIGDFREWSTNSVFAGLNVVRARKIPHQNVSTMKEGDEAVQ